MYVLRNPVKNHVKNHKAFFNSKLRAFRGYFGKPKKPKPSKVQVKPGCATWQRTWMGETAIAKPTVVQTGLTPPRAS